MRILRFALASVLAIASIGALTACDPATGFAVDMRNQDYKLVDSSYKAADVLIAQSNKTLQPTTPLLVGTLNDVNRLETSSPFGRIIAEQVAARFVQRGFVVSDVRFRGAINVKDGRNDGAESGEFFLSRDTSVLKGEQDVGAVITGTYVTSGNTEVMVNLRLIDATTSRVVAAYDYRVPLTSEIKGLIYGSNGGNQSAMFSPHWEY